MKKKELLAIVEDVAIFCMDDRYDLEAEDGSSRNVTGIVHAIGAALTWVCAIEGGAETEPEDAVLQIIEAAESLGFDSERALAELGETLIALFGGE